ncbi:MAG TPA: hypothetical protein VLT45_21585, partial [Kofleriaceae bacterium]|nr:hypothetical protein [Kofleriaceae bacterium]
GRRDQLTAGERTRILRMLRDEGGRMADEESQVFVGVPPAPKYDFDFDDDMPAAPPAPSTGRVDVPAKPAVVVGLQQANERKKRGGPSVAPPPSQLPLPARPATQPPPVPARSKGPTQPPPRSKAPSVAPPMRAGKKPLPRPFEQEPTRAADPGEDLLRAVRSAPGPGRSVFDEPTRMGGVDLSAFDNLDDNATVGEHAPKFLPANTEAAAPPAFDDEATRMANIDAVSRRYPPPPSSKNDERTRAVDIRNDPSISDVDWDLD